MVLKQEVLARLNRQLLSQDPEEGCLRCVEHPIAAPSLVQHATVHTKLVIPRIACAETDLLQLASSTSLQTVIIGEDSGFDIAKLNAAVGRTLFV